MGFWDALFIMAFIVLPALIVGWSAVVLRSLPPSRRISAGRRPARKPRPHATAARRTRTVSAAGLDVTNEPAPAPGAAAPASRRPRPVIHPQDAGGGEYWMPPSGTRQPATGERGRSWGAGSDLTPPTA
ncbi:hypothetical protein [Nitrolancea hollandica]|uniref:hypothetical protein n=1 Tax=Nitrolancea hollandica TaxID=1206749 RepID=UPI000317E63C|nr:hypothetical protein [Nitrolancea hollandica]